MNEVVTKALRALSDAGIGIQPQPETERKPQGRPADDSPRSQAAIKPTVSPAAHRPKAGLPESVLTACNPLAVLARLTLDSLPAASKLNPAERGILADAFESVALQWLAEILKPEEVIREGSTWGGECRKGHPVTEGIFARQLLGWACPECEQVYPASECKLRVRE